MATWALTCENCNQELTKFALAETLENFFFPAKPDFPQGGKEFECLKCGHKAVYMQTDLAYTR